MTEYENNRLKDTIQAKDEIIDEQQEELAVKEKAIFTLTLLLCAACFIIAVFLFKEGIGL